MKHKRCLTLKQKVITHSPQAATLPKTSFFTLSLKNTFQPQGMPD